eukprot:3371738-Heterocapsa_arctica.AAC.1
MEIPIADAYPALSSSSSSSRYPVMPIPAKLSPRSLGSDYPALHIPPPIDHPAAGLAGRPHYSEHPA